MGQDRNRRERSANSGDGSNGNWDDWYGQFDPERTRQMPVTPGQSPANQPNNPPTYPRQPDPVQPGADNARRPWDTPPPGEGTYWQGSSQVGPQPPGPRPDPGYQGSLPRTGATDPRRPRPTDGSQAQRIAPAAQPAPPRSATSRPAQATLAPARSRSGRARRWVVVLLGLLVVLLVAAIGYYITKVQPVINDVFVPSGRPTQTVSITERRNILLMGLDTRSADDSRSDTLILVTVDPKTKAASMLSVPRDLWVQIPDFQGQQFGENRINAAYQFGKSTGVADGGPLLTTKTFEQNFGVHIDNFVEVNFAGFRSIVDSLGGVTVDVPRPLIDNEYPADYGSAYQRVYIPSGIQHMDGRTALQYVRSRHADSDLGRNQRQQAVLLALKQQALNLNMITKIDEVLGEITGTVKTNLSLDEVVALGNLARDLDPTKVQNLTIDASMITETNINGADVLVPDWNLIRPVVQRMFADPSISTENAAIVVQNGTDTAGLATSSRDVLAGAGLRVIGIGNPVDGGSGRYPTTTVYDYSGGAKPATVAEICRLLDIPAANVQPGDPANRPEGADIMVMIGEDKVK